MVEWIEIQTGRRSVIQFCCHMLKSRFVGRLPRCSSKQFVDLICFEIEALRISVMWMAWGNFTYSFIHSYIYSFIHSYIYSFIHSFTLSFIHSLIHSFTHSLMHSFTHSLTHSLFENPNPLTTSFVKKNAKFWDDASHLIILTVYKNLCPQILRVFLLLFNHSIDYWHGRTGDVFKVC